MWYVWEKLCFILGVPIIVKEREKYSELKIETKLDGQGRKTDTKWIEEESLFRESVFWMREKKCCEFSRKYSVGKNTLIGFDLQKPERAHAGLIIF